MQGVTSHSLVAATPVAPTDLQARLLDYASRVGELGTTDDVLGALQAVTDRGLRLCVLGAVRFPINDTHWKSLRSRKSVFLQKNVPDGWWEEHEALAQGKFRPTLFLARSSLASYTWTEAQRLFEPIGVDRWAFELALKYGMRDGLTCPVGGRWAVAFWSRRTLCKVLTTSDRIMLSAAASFAALRLEQLVGTDAERIGARTPLTPRELAALRLVSNGAQNHDIAQALGLSEETIRSHLKKAQAKLGVRSRAQAACEAIRQNLIP